MLATWFPIDCVLCENPPKVLCAECEANLPIRQRTVTRAGLLPGFALANYEGQAQQVVHAFKQSGSLSLARTMAAPMASAVLEWLAQNAASAGELIYLVPAPSRPASIRHRGYVPAEVLAQAIKRKLRTRGVITRVSNCVNFAKGVKDQSQLSASERSTNLEGRVWVESGASFRLKMGRVILIDDIVTTGSTLRNVASALEQSGVKPEIFLSFAETL